MQSCKGLNFLKTVAVEDTHKLQIDNRENHKVRFPQRMTSPLSLVLWGEPNPNPLRRPATASVHRTHRQGYWKWYLRLPFILADWPPSTRLLHMVCARCRFKQTVTLIEQTAPTSQLLFPAPLPSSNVSRHVQTRALTADSLWLFAGLLFLGSTVHIINQGGVSTIMISLFYILFVLNCLVSNRKKIK